MLDQNIKKENELKKEYLRRYGDAVRAAKQIEEEIRQLRLDTMMPAVVNDGMPHGSSSGSDLSGYAAKVDAMMEDLRNQMEARIDIKREIIEKIEEMENETEKLILRYRYIHLLKWEEIAVKIEYEYRNVLYIHGKALKHFQIPENFA